MLPQTAVTIAKHHVLHAARTDYWWIKNQDEWITDGGTAAIGRVETRDESGVGREVERAGATDAGRAGRHCCGTQQRPDMKCAANV